MDEALLQRFRSGDPQARTAMRNQLRAVAARVLMDPHWELADHDYTRALEQRAALKALECEGTNVLDFATAAMEAATELCIEHMRHRDATPVPAISAAQLARLALETASRREAEEAQKVLEESPPARRQLEVARSALRSALKAGAAGAAVSPTPTAQPRPGQAARRTTQPRPRSAARVQPRRSSRQIRKTPGSMGPLVVPSLIVATVLVLAWQRWAPEPESVEVEVAWILPQELPPTGGAEELDGLARQAVVDMGQGQCKRAAERLHMEHLKDSSNTWVRYYEGLAWVCDRDGPKALEALRDVEATAEEPPFGLGWWLAQAELLGGDMPTGLARLDELANTDHPRALQAATLARVVREEIR